jgi:DNA-binding transcriptional regulator YiaG
MTPVLVKRQIPPDELRSRREAAGLSLREFAALLEVSEGLLRHWESGRRPVPRGRQTDLQRLLASLSPVDAPATMTGRELRELRERAQLTQADVAHLLGVTRAAVTGWERGEVPDGRHVLREILAADVPPDAALMRAQRARAGWKQAELAERLGVRQTQVSAWERGEASIPSARWPEIRDLLAAAEPDIRPTQFQRPVDADELRSNRQRLGWSQAEFARRLDVSKPTVGNWEIGNKPVPEQRWQQIRELFGTAEPESIGPRDRVAETLELVLAVLEREPGLGRLEVIQRVDSPEPHVRGAIARALEQDRIHEQRVPRARGDGVLRYLQALFPGPVPAELPRIDRVSLVVPQVQDAVAAAPGRTRRQIAESLRHDRRLSEAAIDRALSENVVHVQSAVARTGNGARVRLGLFPGASPTTPAPAPIDGAELGQLRARLLVSQQDFAERLGVDPAQLRRWEGSEVPEAWRHGIREALRPLVAEADARNAGLRQRIIDTVRSQPGMARWGDLPRQLHRVERGELGRLLDELVAAGELHERPTGNGHGGGLFVGPAPAEWEPGPALSADELRSMRQRSGLQQRDLAEIIGVPASSVNTWERGTKAIPPYRRPQLRRAIAAGAPAAIPAAELLAERDRTGLSRAALAAQLGVTADNVGAWETGTRPVPANLRDRLRETLAAAPTMPAVTAAELRGYRRHQGLTSRALADQLGVTAAIAEKWQQRGVPRPRAAAVRAILDAAAEPAQTHLFGTM